MTRIFLMMAIIFASVSYIQAQDSTLTIKISDLEKLAPGAADALKKAYSDSITEHVLTKRIERYGNFVGVGKEIGVAVNGALTAVNDQMVKFSETKLGNITVFLVVWKVLYKDVLGIVIGIPVLIGWTALFMGIIYFLFMARKIKLKNAEGKIYEEMVNDDTWDGDKWGGFAVTGIIYVIVAWIIVAYVIF